MYAAKKSQQNQNIRNRRASLDSLPVSPVRSNVIGTGPPQLSLSALNDSGISNSYANVS